MAVRKNWTRHEVTKALSLYCQIPFGQIGARNPAIRDLAERLGRTPDAVALKLSNLASLDPTLRARGVIGMQHRSSVDRLVWNEFFGHWGELAEALAIENFETPGPSSESPWVLRESPPDETERIGTRRERRGQTFFRNAVLSAYDGKCCITGIARPELIRASHIVPWSTSTEKRLSPMNGLALNALHDAAFDSGLITLDEERRLVLSPYLKDHVPRRIHADFFLRFEGEPIADPVRFSPLEENLAYHREFVFNPLSR